MSISYVGGSSAEGTTTSLPAGAQPRDLAVVLAHRPSGGFPTMPSGWTNRSTWGFNPLSRVAYRWLTAADIAAGDVGVWSDSARVQVAVYRAVTGVQGANVAGNSGTSYFQTPALTGLPSGSWGLALAVHDAATNTRSATVSGYVTRSGGFGSGYLGLFDTAVAVSSVGAGVGNVNATGNSAGFGQYLTAAPETPAGETYYPESDTFWQSPQANDAAYAITAATDGTVRRSLTGGQPTLWSTAAGQPGGMLLVGPGVLTIRSLSNDNSTSAPSSSADVLVDGAVAASIPAGVSGQSATVRNTAVAIPAGTHLVQVNLDPTNNRWYFDGGTYGPLPVPVAAFTPDVASGDAPLTVAFTNQSTGLGTLSYLWDFGDGQTSTEASPTHVYPVSGTYTVTLTTSNEGGVSDPVTFDITVVMPDFTAKARPVWDNSLNPVTQFGTTVADVVNYYRASTMDDSTAAFSLVRRAVECLQVSPALDAKGRLFWHAALTLWPDVANGYAAADLTRKFGTPA